MRFLVMALLAGGLFAVGLVLGGMTQPARVVGFLDVTGTWDPSLAFVMGGAVGVHLILLRLVVRRRRPYLAPRFQLPTRKDIDAPLVVGSALFGFGWGLGGYCPGPGMTALVAQHASTLWFVASMLAGMALYELLPKAAR